jgi:hypothetical protein
MVAGRQRPRRGRVDEPAVWRLVVLVLGTLALGTCQLPLEGRPCSPGGRRCIEGFFCCRGTCELTCPGAPPPPVSAGSLEVREFALGLGTVLNEPETGDLSALARDRDGSLLIGTRCGGLYRYRPQEPSPNLTLFDAYNTPMPESGITDILPGADITWLASHGGHLYGYDGRMLSLYGANPVLRTSETPVHLMAEDARRRLWFITHDNRLARLSARAIDAVIDPEFVAGRQMTSIAAVGDTIWVGTTAGLVSFDEVNKFREVPLIGQAQVRDLAADGGSVVAAAGDSLYRLEGGTWSLLPVDGRPEEARVTRVRPGEGGRLGALYGTGTALALGDSTGLVHRSVGFTPVDILFADGDSTWLTAGSGGLLRSTPEELTTVLASFDKNRLLTWRFQGASFYLATPAREVAWPDVLKEPATVFQKKIRFRGRIGPILEPNQREPRHWQLVDESSTLLPVAPVMDSDWLRFHQASGTELGLPFWVGGELQDYYGFLEYGGCYGTAPLIADRQPFALYIVEHYPVEMDEDGRAEVAARFKAFCDANVCPRR